MVCTTGWLMWCRLFLSGSSSFGVDLIIKIKSKPNDEEPKLFVKIRLFVVSSGFDQILYRSSQQVNNADERIVISVAPGSAFCCLEDAIKCFNSSVVVS